LNNVDTIRICFSKSGKAKYISHLDLMRTMTRVLRRAQIPLWYTEGFSKHPYITFAAPLSLGYVGECEYMDFRLEQDMPMQEVVERLNQHVPEGIVVLSAARAAHKVGEIAASRWRLRFPADAESRIRDVLSQPEIAVEKRTKKGTMKTLDIRPCISDEQCSLEDDGCVLSLTLPTGEQSINPSLLISYINNGVDIPVEVTRQAVYMKDGEIFS